MSDGATRKFVYARGMTEGQGNFLIAADAPPATRRGEARRTAGHSTIIEYGYFHAPYGYQPPVRRKVFISYFRGDTSEVEAFVNWWGIQQSVFIPRIVGACGNEAIDSQNAEYVISKIRREQIADSTVTMLLVGSCTHSRRHVDWELKASLRQGEDCKPNGLLGIILPSQGTRAYLPDRFMQNWNAFENSYARYYSAPASAQDLARSIEDAYWARETRARLITNSAEMMGYNSRCLVCNEMHSLRKKVLRGLNR
jgi:hypothetical protein